MRFQPYEDNKINEETVLAASVSPVREMMDMLTYSAFLYQAVQSGLGEVVKGLSEADHDVSAIENSEKIVRQAQLIVMALSIALAMSVKEKKSDQTERFNQIKTVSGTPGSLIKNHFIGQLNLKDHTRTDPYGPGAIIPYASRTIVPCKK